jgi:hypothetical protein
MRPRSIILFERIELLAILCGIVGAALGWERTVALVSRFGFGGGFVAIVQGLGFAVMLLLLYFIARQASVVAKWIFVVLVALGAVNIARSYGVLFAMGATGLLSAAQTLLQLFAAWLLFRPDAASWFDGPAD